MSSSSDIKNKTVKYAYGASWLLIFHHDSTGGYFSNDNVLNNDSNYLYSILDELDNYKINHKFTFLLEYPGLEGYIMNEQTTNPAKSENVKGYRLLHNSWSDGIVFNGFALSTQEFTFIDGTSAKNNWFYALGQYIKWSNGDLGGPYNANSNKRYVKQVNFWVKISGGNKHAFRKENQ